MPDTSSSIRAYLCERRIDPLRGAGFRIDEQYLQRAGASAGVQGKYSDNQQATMRSNLMDDRA